MSAAVVVKLTGKASIVRGGESIPLAPNAELRAGDSVRTEAGAKLEMRFADGAIMELGPSTQVEIGDFAFDPQGVGKPSMIINMLEGAVRSISGKLVEQNPEAFKLTSPMGTVGIRGTITLHFITQEREIHIVVDIDSNHTVHINTPDGRSIILTESATGVTITAGDLSPLVLEDIPPGRMLEYLRIWLEQALTSENPHSFLNSELSALVTSLAALFINGHLGVAPLEGTDALFGALGGTFGGLYGNLETSSLTAYLAAPSGNSLDDPAQPLPLSPLSPAASPGNPAAPPPWNVLTGAPGVNDWLLGTPANDLMYGYSGNDFIWTGTGQDMAYGGFGSSDTIVKPVVMGAGSVLCGDEDVLPAGEQADNDFIYVGNAPALAGTVSTGSLSAGQGPGDMSGGVIYGNARIMEEGSFVDTANIGSNIFGNHIEVQGVMSGGAIYGDAQEARSGVVFGSDTIRVGGMSGGEIYADAAIYSGQGYSAGNNLVQIAGNMGGGSIFGGYGSDTITVGGAMTGGLIDGGYGVDSISVNGAFSGGTIRIDAADVLTISGNEIAGGTVELKEARSYAINRVSGGGISGSNGNDTITVTTMSGGLIDGGAGADSIRVSGTFSGGTIRINATDSLNVGLFDGGWVELKEGMTYRSTSLNSGGILGSAEADTITLNTLGGTAAIYGGGGNDNITITSQMRGGSIIGNAGSDTITVDTTMSGGLIDGKGGRDSITVYALSGGTIRVYAGDTLDVLNYSNSGSGTVELMEAVSVDLGVNFGDGGCMQGSGGNDTITVASMSGSAINGGNGADVISIGGTMNGGTIDGGTGNDSITVGGRMANGTINGGDGNDSITIGSYMSGGLIDGGDGANSITVIGDFYGGTIRIGASDVLSIGGYIQGTVELKEATSLTVATLGRLGWGTGASIIGSAGSDTITIDGSASGEIIDGGDGADVITIGSNMTNLTTVGGAGNDIITIHGYVSGSMIYGDDSLAGADAGNDIITIHGNVTGDAVSGGSLIDGGGGNDVITVHGNLSRGSLIDGGDGNDVITVNGTMSGSSTTIYGGGGDDVITMDTMGYGTIDGGNGNDSIIVGTINVSTGSIYGGDGNDVITVGTMSHGTIDGGDGNDVITVNGTMSRGTILAGNGDDVISIGSISRPLGYSNTGTIDLRGATDTTANTKELNIGYYNWRSSGAFTIECGEASDSIVISSVGAQSGNSMTINNFDGNHDTLDLSAIFGSNGWNWDSNGDASAWTVTAYSGTTMMATFAFTNGTNVEAGLILV
jgi:hypothetical protein